MDFIAKKLFGESFSELRRMNRRQLVQQGVALGKASNILSTFDFRIPSLSIYI